MNPPSQANTAPFAKSVEENSGGTHNNGYAPSVPLSVYRELSAELQTTKAMVDTLHRQNKQLSRQNQTLRHEIQRFVHSAEQLGHFAGVLGDEGSKASDPIDLVEAEGDYANAAPSTLVSMPKPRAQSGATQRQERPEATPRKPRLFTEQPESSQRLNKSSSHPKDLSNLWLATTILLVIFTAFGAGFLIMRPLLNR